MTKISNNKYCHLPEKEAEAKPWEKLGVLKRGEKISYNTHILHANIYDCSQEEDPISCGSIFCFSFSWVDQIGLNFPDP